MTVALSQGKTGQTNQGNNNIRDAERAAQKE
jgi:hypothetical protein